MMDGGRPSASNLFSRFFRIPSQLPPRIGVLTDGKVGYGGKPPQMKERLNYLVGAEPVTQSFIFRGTNPMNHETRAISLAVVAANPPGIAEIEPRSSTNERSASVSEALVPSRALYCVDASQRGAGLARRPP